MFSVLGTLPSPINAAVQSHKHLVGLFDQWSDDAFDFVRHDVPKIVTVIIIALVLIRILRTITRRLSHISKAGQLPSGVRAQQIRTLSGVVYSVGVFVILFLTIMSILDTVNINIKPLLASAGIVGLAIGFGAQTLVHDVVTGFFILVENQFEIGDTVKLVDRTGVVEVMSL